MPTFEVHGIVGGYAGPGVKTIVPHEAEAKLSCRLVPGQKPREVFRRIKRFIAGSCPDAEVVFDAALEPYLADARRSFFASRAGAPREETFGKKAALTREGGSIGAVVTMARVAAQGGRAARAFAARGRLPRHQRELFLAPGGRRHGHVLSLLPPPGRHLPPPK